MVLPDGRIESCGNFHGAPLGFACDFLAIAAAEVGAIAERRTDRLLDAGRSQGLPPFLAEDAGVDSGMMLAHYAQAAMVAENRRLAAPASVDSLPTSAMQEDHVSMGWGAARKLRRAAGQPDPDPRRRARMRRPRRSICGRRCDPAPGPRPALAALRERRARARVLTATPLPSSPRPRRLVALGRAHRRGRARRSESSDERARRGPRAPRDRDLLPGLAAGGGHADAHEQPRSGRGREPGRARRLRRNRPCRPLLGGLRRDRAHAPQPG